MKRYRICITGPLSKVRSHYVALIQARGHFFDEAVRHGTDLLVMADPNSGSNKAKSAVEKGVRCISEATLNTILNDTAGKGFFNAQGNYVVGFSRNTITNWDQSAEPTVAKPEPTKGPVKQTASRMLSD